MSQEIISEVTQCGCLPLLFLLSLCVPVMLESRNARGTLHNSEDFRALPYAIPLPEIPSSPHCYFRTLPLEQGPTLMSFFHEDSMMLCNPKRFTSPLMPMCLRCSLPFIL